MLSNFMPSSGTEWIYFGIAMLLLAMILLYNAALMKCKNLLESYVSENKNLNVENKQLIDTNIKYLDIIVNSNLDSQLLSIDE